jgi:hypothetical protein
MAVRVDRCKASGDCRADAQSLTQLNPPRLARRLLIYTPTAAEIDELLDRARQDLPEIGANEAVHRVVSHNPDSFWAIARRDRVSAKVREAEGFQAFLMLNEAGLAQLIAGTFEGTDPDLSLLAAQNENPAGICIWCTHAKGPLAAAMTLTLQKMSTPLYRDADIYAWAATPEAHHALERAGFRRGVSGAHSIARSSTATISRERICSAMSGMSPPPLCAFAISRISRRLSGWRCAPSFAVGGLRNGSCKPASRFAG